MRLLECDVVVYNISEKATPELIDEATWALTGKGLTCWPLSTQQLTSSTFDMLFMQHLTHAYRLLVLTNSNSCTDGRMDFSEDVYPGVICDDMGVEHFG